MDSIVFEKISSLVDIKGVIQVGSNIGQEISLFRQYTNNIICFEPIPEIYSILKSRNPDLACYNIGLGEISEIKEMFISSNNGESSSFLKPLNHTKSFSHINFNQKKSLEIRRFDELDIDVSNFNVLVSDTQGFEIQVMKGFGDLLKELDFIYVEYIENELYENDSNLKSITEYVESLGFETEMIIPEIKGVFGNVLYKKIK
jgi:FkbM family methyltransferase